MLTLTPLHERTFAGKPLKSFKIYNDPFDENEVCVELAFVDGQVEYVSIGPARPEIVSRGVGYETVQVMDSLTPNLGTEQLGTDGLNAKRVPFAVSR